MRFNLADDAWIPVLCMNGDPRVLSLREVFADCHRIGCVADPNPLNSAAMNRLLLACAYAALGAPADQRAFEAQVRTGLDVAVIAEWVDAHRDRFELFDSGTPFAQNGAMRAYAGEGTVKPSTVLLLDAAGEGPVTHDIRYSDCGMALRPDQAARELLARQAFSVGGIQPFPARPFGAGARTGKHAVACKRPIAWAAAPSLAGSLAANLVPAPSVGKINFSWHDGRSRVVGADRAPDGVADALTWLSRSILLLPSPDGLVRSVMLCHGEYPGDAVSPSVIPHSLYDELGAPVPSSLSRPAWRAWGMVLALETRWGILGHLSELPGELRHDLVVEVTGQVSYQARIDGHMVTRLPARALTWDPGTARHLLIDEPARARSALWAAARTVSAEHASGGTHAHLATSTMAALTREFDVTVAPHVQALLDGRTTSAQWSLVLHTAARHAVESVIAARGPGGFVAAELAMQTLDDALTTPEKTRALGKRRLSVRDGRRSPSVPARDEETVTR